MPAKGRIPSNPPRRRPKVAGLSRRGRPEPPPDTQPETPSDTQPEARPEAPPDTRPEAPSDTRPEAPPDTQLDAQSPEALAEPPRPTVAEAAAGDTPQAAATDPARTDRGPTDTTPSDTAPDEAAAPPAAAPTNGARGRRFAGALLVVLLVLVTVVFGTAAVFFRGQAARAGTGAADNRAVVDTAVTSEVVGQVSTAIETVLSYDYTKLDENERAAAQVITGRYQDEFGKTFGDVRRTAPEQKLVLTTTVLLAGVTMLNDGRAEVIATMDLNAVRDTTPYNSPGRVKVIASKVDGRWKIAEMTLL